ncbi:MAG TPA: hypothetical protein VK675_00540 [Candidatus Paceibacterota bacterium]|nr:hypothetical protein [Candidatus Paceibacterota bacterium]
MDFKQSLERGVFFGFVPHRLEMKEFPEFNHFPFNVLFMRYGIRDGKRVSGSATYEPDFWTYRKKDNLCSMYYHNIYGGDAYLKISYDEKDERYTGEKFVNGKSVGSAHCVKDWNMFFAHFTALGLFQGEQCEFKDTA